MADNTGSPLPLPQNINLIGIGAALIAVLVAFGVKITPDQRDTLLALLAVLTPLLLAAVHTFINHPDNVQKALDYGRALEVAARTKVGRGGKVIIALFLAGTMLMGCATPVPVPTDPNSILAAAQLTFNTAISVYDGVCAVDAGASFCTPQDQAMAAALEQTVTNAIAAARAAISGNPADIPTALQDVQNAIGAFENFVNQLQATKALKLAKKAGAV